MNTHLLPFAAFGLLALSACQNDPATSGDDREASGDVLEGTISDAMLPIDEVQSQPPLAEPESSEPGTGEAAEDGEDGEAAEGAEEPGEAAASEAPAAAAEPAE